MDNLRYENYLEILSCNKAYFDAYNATVSESSLFDDTKLYLLVFAPAIIGFVDWVLSDAVEKGKTRLYFLSRDGYQMYIVAKRLIAEKELPIKCKYLNVSRHSMRMPSFFIKPENAIDLICTGGIDVTPTKVLLRASLNYEECIEVLKEIGLESQKDIICNNRQLQTLKGKLLKSERLKEYIANNSKSTYDNAIGYLKQEGLFDDNEFSIVDSGWVGTLQRSIEELLQSVNTDAQVNGYYFGMYEYPSGVDRSRFCSYYFSAKSGLQKKIRFANSLFETIISSPEGMTLEYEKVEDGYVPVKNRNLNPNEEQIQRNLDALQVYLKNLNCNMQLNDLELTQNLFNLFMASPTMYEVECFGNNLFSDDVLDNSYKCVAANLSLKQIQDQHFIKKALIILGFNKATIFESAWIEGSAARLLTGTQLQNELKHIRRYKLFVHLRKEIKSI